MKRLTLMMLAGLSFLFIQAQPKTVWNLDRSHSSIKFSIDHMVISEVDGGFKSFTADIRSDKPDFTDVQGKVVIDIKSIDTENEKRDAHLVAPDFFDAEQYPQMTFVIKKFTKVNGKQYKVSGDLTLHGVTKPVTFDAKFGGIIKDNYGLTRAGLIVTGEIDRYAFGLKYNAALEAGNLAIGQQVKIKVNLEFTKAN